ncbi:MAG: FAD-binding oxidoreductase [Chloroflexota bacterium]
MADFVIIGGGVYGCAVAWELARQGAEVCLLEAKEVACGASGGLGTRGVRANGRDVRELPFMEMAYEIWPTLHEALGAPTGYKRIGNVTLIEQELDLRKAEMAAWMQAQQGIPSQILSAAELREREPYVGEQVIGALYCPKDGISDHTTTTRSYAQAARKLGAEIRENTLFDRLEAGNGHISAVITAEEERIPIGKTLFMLSNYHLLGYLKGAFNLQLPVWPLLPQVMLTESISPHPIQHLIGHASRKLAMKMVEGDRVMISGGWRGRYSEAGQKGETLPDQVEGNRLEAVAAFPVLADIGVADAAADRWELIAVDNIPIIDHLPGHNNVIMATGWSGHGWAISPAVSRLLAEWALTGQRPALFNPFRYSRFAKVG